MIVRNIVLAGMLFCVGASQQVLASTIALTWSAGGGLGSSTETRGWEFTTSRTIDITALGWYDDGGGGFANSHEIGIWNSTGTLLMTATVNAGTVDVLIGGFRYDTGLSGSTVLASGTYVIGGLSTVDDASWRLVPVANVTTGAEITFVENRHNGVSATFSDQTLHQVGLDVGYFGPDFQYDVVPEPPALALLVLGFVALGFSLRKEVV